jgi:hypothetical protein
MKYLKHRSDSDEYQRPLHIADEQGRPVCRNGGMRLQSWNLVELGDDHPWYVCGSCRRILEAQAVNEGI